MKKSSLSNTSAPHTCSASFVRFVVQFLDASDLDGSSLARQAGIDDAWLLTPEGRVPHTNILSLWRLARIASGDEALGITVARQAGPEALSLFGYSMMLSRTLAELLQRAMRDLHLLGDLFSLEISNNEKNTSLSLVVRPGIDAPPECGDAILATMLVTARRLGADPSFAPVSMEMRRKAPQDPLPFTLMFGTEPRFGQASNRMVFNNADLERPVLSAHAGLAEIYDRFVTSRPAATLSDTVRHHIAARLPDGVPAIETLASILHMTERTMHRRLSDEGVSYRQLLDETRRNLAAEYLAHSTLPLAQVAVRLGFAEPGSFTRAYKRWYGTAPRQARKN